MLLPHNWHFFWSFSLRGYFSSISTSGKDPWKISTRGVEVGEVNVNWKKQKLLQLRKISCVIYRKQNFFLQGKKSRKRFLRKNNHLGNSSPSPHDAAFLLSRLPFVCVVVQLYHDICRVNELFFSEIYFSFQGIRELLLHSLQLRSFNRCWWAFAINPENVVVLVRPFQRSHKMGTWPKIRKVCSSNF